MILRISVSYLRPVAPALALGLILSGCANGGGMGSGVTSFTQEGRVGPNDGSDSCHAQAVALDETGNFFGQDILTGAAAGAVGGGLIGALAGGNLKSALIGAAVGGTVGAAGGYWEALQQQQQSESQMDATVTNNLTTENAQINQTQLAFNNDMDCRFGQAQAIRQQYAAGQITQAQAETQMAQVKSLAQRDLTLAQTINGQIQSRGAQFDTAVTNLNNGTPAVSSDRTAAISEPAAIREDTPLYLRPDPSAPVVGQATEHEPVTVTGSSNGYALVQADDGTRGFAPMDDVGKPGSHHVLHIPASTAAAPSGGSQIQQLDGSNAASRDAFAQNVSVSQSAVANGFQLAS
jgi:uncharacterized protein YcfJ